MHDAKKFLPIVLIWIFLFVSIQKFIFGVNAFVPSASRLSDFYGIFLLLLSLVILIYGLLTTKRAATHFSSMKVAIAGTLSLITGSLLIFEVPHSLGQSLSWIAMFVCLGIYALAFCVILFTQLAWIQRKREEYGIRTIALCFLAAGFMYSIITPSDANESLYMRILEILSLPLSALIFSIQLKRFETTPLKLNPTEKKLSLRMILSSALFLFVNLLISYTDALTANYPTVHHENPTFYALLLVGISAIALLLIYRKEETNLAAAISNIVLFVNVIFLISYVVVLYFANYDGEFCYQFTCFIRRYAALSLFVLLFLISSHFSIPLEIGLGLAFFVPYYAAKACMFFFLDFSQKPSFDASGNLQLNILLILGLIFVILLGIAWYLTIYLRSKPSNSGAISQPGEEAVLNQRVNGVESLGRKFRLSDREKSVLYYLSVGYSIGKISEKLFISENTVGSHVQSIYKKMNLHSKQDIIDTVNDVVGIEPQWQSDNKEPLLSQDEQ